MALVVLPPSRESVRRSLRISRRLPVSSRDGITTSLARTSTVLVQASTRRTSRQRDAYKSRSRVSTASPTPSRHRAKSLSAAAIPVPVRAGTKRKRLSSPSDQPDLPRYKLVLAESHPDDEAQKPRQLRYAKRQRLLVSHSGNDVPTGPIEQIAPRPCSFEGQENRPCVVGITPSSAEVATISEPEKDREPEVAHVEVEGPVFTPLCRRTIPWRHRTVDSTEPTLWKAVCQERVEHLKTIYRDVFRAVVHAEALAVQEDQAKAAAADIPASIAGAAQSSPCAAESVIQFELYTLSVDADGDTDMDAGSSSDSDDGDDSDEDMEDIDEVAYEQVLILDTPAFPVANVPRLPRLSSIRVSSLEPYPPSTPDGAAFIGRGTPADPSRLADWAAPPLPLPPRALSPASWSPEPPFFTPDMVTPPPASAMPTDFSMNIGGVEMSWLDPTLHAQSASPSPMPAAFPGAMPIFDAGSGFAFDGMPLPPMDAAAPNPTGCALHESFLECLRAPGCSGPGLGAAPFYAPACPSFPTQTPALPAPGTELTPSFASPSAVFPNPELAPFVRSHLIPGSMTLGNALG